MTKEQNAAVDKAIVDRINAIADWSTADTEAAVEKALADWSKADAAFDEAFNEAFNVDEEEA